MKNLYVVVSIEGINESDLFKTCNLQEAKKYANKYRSYYCKLEIRKFENGVYDLGQYDLIKSY